MYHSQFFKRMLVAVNNSEKLKFNAKEPHAMFSKRLGAENLDSQLLHWIKHHYYRGNCLGGEP